VKGWDIWRVREDDRSFSCPFSHHHFSKALDRVPAWVGELMKQNRDRPVEIILAGSHSDESLKVMAADHPEVVFIPFPPMTPLPRLLGAAVSRSTGEIITITDMTCEIDRNWISEVMKAHEKPSPVIGGAVEPKGLKGWWSGQPIFVTMVSLCFLSKRAS